MLLDKFILGSTWGTELKLGTILYLFKEKSVLNFSFLVLPLRKDGISDLLKPDILKSADFCVFRENYAEFDAKSVMSLKLIQAFAE